MWIMCKFAWQKLYWCFSFSRLKVNIRNAFFSPRRFENPRSFFSIQSTKILLMPPKSEIIFGALLMQYLNFSPLLPILLSLFQLCDSKSCLCFIFCNGFVHWFMASFLYCSHHSFSPLKTIAKSKMKKRKLSAIRDGERQ